NWIEEQSTQLEFVEINNGDEIVKTEANAIIKELETVIKIDMGEISNRSIN
ncbi:1244_t:CDS:1, partial [Rhizophagus irregularis]